MFTAIFGLTLASFYVGNEVPLMEEGLVANARRALQN